MESFKSKAMQKPKNSYFPKRALRVSLPKRRLVLVSFKDIGRSKLSWGKAVKN